ncbi:MAG: class A beta-lactamase-related serine hydrolase [Synergistaceae bacterium]|nr:class A beta-lactamase-related serine hydrolase [Synergistaceae bacterium]
MNKEYSLEKRILRETEGFSGHMGVCADDLRGGVVAVNADEEFETASTIKAFILADLFRRVHEGTKKLSEKLPYTSENYLKGSGVMRYFDFGDEMSAKNVATLMIIVSDNVATNIIIDYLGLDSINDTIQSLGFRRTKLLRKLCDQAQSPLGITTPREYGRLFALVAREELISPEASRGMLDIFKAQQLNNILVNWLPPYYLTEDSFPEAPDQKTFVASKSGSLKSCRNDGGIVGTPFGRYAVAIMTRDFHDKLYHKFHEALNYGSRVARLLYDQYLALEGRFFLK